MSKKVAYFDGFTIELTEDQAHQGSHQGECDADLEALIQEPEIFAQLADIPAGDIRNELRQYGAWDEIELENDQLNQIRILWIACGNIVDEL